MTEEQKQAARQSLLELLDAYQTASIACDGKAMVAARGDIVRAFDAAQGDALAGDDAAHLLRGTPYEAAAEAQALAQKWEERGVIVTIERVSHTESPAMGNHYPVAHARPKRSQA